MVVNYGNELTVPIHFLYICRYAAQSNISDLNILFESPLGSIEQTLIYVSWTSRY